MWGDRNPATPLSSSLPLPIQYTCLYLKLKIEQVHENENSSFLNITTTWIPARLLNEKKSLGQDGKLSSSMLFLMKTPGVVFHACVEKTILLSEHFAASQIWEEECISTAGVLQQFHACSVAWSIMCTPNQVVWAFGQWTWKENDLNPFSHMHRCLLALPLFKKRRVNKCRNRQNEAEEKHGETPARGT